jgi:dTDP-4-dehydrorhamnose reductase
MQSVELTDPDVVFRVLADCDPDVIVHLAAISAIDVAQKDPVQTRAVNVQATRHLAEWASSRSRRLVFASTDLVFDGTRSGYVETDQPSPLGVYGQTKVEGERFVLEAGGLVARLSLLYGPSRSQRKGYFDMTIAALAAGIPQTFFHDEFRTPLDYDSAARLLIRLAESPSSGIVHVAGPERMSRFDLMRRAAVALGIDPSLIRANARSEVSFALPRPADLSLNCGRLEHLLGNLDIPPVEEAVARMCR